MYLNVGGEATLLGQSTATQTDAEGAERWEVPRAAFQGLSLSLQPCLLPQVTFCRGGLANSFRKSQYLLHLFPQLELV